MCSRQKRSIANCADGNCRLFNPLYFSCTIICGCPLQVPHHVPLTEFVSSLIPSAVEECCFSPAGWLVLTVRASQWLLGDNQGFKKKKKSLHPHLSSVHHSPLPAKFKCMTQHCDMSGELCISVCVSLSSFFSVSFTPSAFQICFYTVLLHSHFKGQWF